MKNIKINQKIIFKKIKKMEKILLIRMVINKIFWILKWIACQRILQFDKVLVKWKLFLRHDNSKNKKSRFKKIPFILKHGLISKEDRNKKLAKNVNVAKYMINRKINKLNLTGNIYKKNKLLSLSVNYKEKKLYLPHSRLKKYQNRIYKYWSWLQKLYDKNKFLGKYNWRLQL